MKPDGAGTLQRIFKRPWRLAAIALIAGLFATNIYRAATQSVSHDEGVMFYLYLPGSFSRVFDFVGGNHHPLSDFLCKVSITLFGLSELSLRLPALLCGLLYFYSALRISEFHAGATWQLEPVINFYRAAWRLMWMDPVLRESADGSFDYYFLAFGDVPLVEQRGLTPLLRDRLSGTVLAKKPGP